MLLTLKKKKKTNRFKNRLINVEEGTAHTQKYDQSREAELKRAQRERVHVTAFNRYSIDKLRSNVETKVEGEKSMHHC